MSLCRSSPTATASNRDSRWVTQWLCAPSLHFFVLAFALLVTLRAAEGARRTVRVVVPSRATVGERQLRIDEAVLVEESLARGWARTDPVIRERLIANLRFARGGDQSASGDRDSVPSTEAVAHRSATDAALLEEALRLDMQRSDIIVRRRLVSRAERLMTSDIRSARVTDEELLAFRDAHPERFRAPVRLRFTDVFLSSERHGAALATAADAMRSRLVVDALPPDRAAALSDPLLYSPGGHWVAADKLRQRLGGTLAERIAEAPIGEWAGPYASAYGLHVVWVHERREAALPSLDVSRASVLGAYRDARHTEALRERMNEMRDRYEVVVEEREGAP